MLARRLSYGDTIGLIAPAGVESLEKIQKGIDKLKSLGFKVKEGKYIYKRYGYLAGEDYERAEDIMNMFKDESVAMILCVRGGYGAMRLLPYLDFSIIKKHPKLFIGYSDITVLLNSINRRTKLITFHGPMLTSELNDEYTLVSFLNTLMEKNEAYKLKNPENISIETNCDKSVEGKLVGGNLSLICSTMGTAYEIDFENNIIFLEEVGEIPYRIDRMLTQLMLSNKLKKCSGIILGQFTDCEDLESGFTLKEVLSEFTARVNKPVLMNLASGHDYPKLTLPIGAKTRLSCKECSIEIAQAVVK